MKKIFVLLIAVLMLLGSCGAPADTTVGDVVTDAPDTGAIETDAPETNAPETDAPETEPVVMRDDYTIPVKGDTYVLNKNGSGDQSDVNFGSEAEIHVKNNPGSLTRYGYLKFDISELATDDSFTSVELDLHMITKQNDPGNPENAVVEIYGVDPSGWEEGTLTFNTQPTLYGLAASRDDLGKAKTTYSFAITAYVRNALSKGQTEIALYIKDATDIPLHLKFTSKEAGENAPKLSVYHGTKTDNSTYESKGDSDFATELSSSGLDTLVGLHSAKSYEIPVIEDTYVEAGTSADKNFGASETLDFKAVSSKVNNYYRITLLKFDISDIADQDYERALLRLNCTSMEDAAIPTPINVYGCFPSDWDEMTVTYNTLPEREKLITSYVVNGMGLIFIDVTDYIKKYENSSQKQISFYLEGDTSVVRRLQFTSRETETAPAIILRGDEETFTTQLKFNGVNPWDYAMENVSDWLNRWEIIKQGGESDVETIEKIDAEYSLSVGATMSPNGAKTTYTQYPTRTVDTLINFTASANEGALYDIYGGFMDESMKQEATGFFYTTKIGDRWWTIDPLGYPYFRVACVAISVGNTAQKAVALSKYGNTANWAKATTDRLHELGFNSAGGWSHTASLAYVEQPLSQTSIMYVLKNYCGDRGLDISKGGSTTLLYDILPVFDPDFETYVGPAVAKAVKGYENASFIYGWMSDNELPQTSRMLDNALFLDVNDERFTYTYATAWTFMYLKTGKLDVSIEDVTQEHRLEYRAMVYDRYFKLVSEALERYAPTHQYMGCRFLEQCYIDEYVLRVAGYYCDVISYNYYGAWEGSAELLANQQRWAGKPVIITEWYAKGMDVWEKDNRITNKSGAGWTVKDQADRGRFYQNYALQLLECKGCVGFDWFKYLDNDPDDLSADLSNRDSNKGLYDNYHEEYTGLTEYMSELNNQKYTLIKFFDER